MHQNWRIELLINWTTLPEAMQSICYNAAMISAWLYIYTSASLAHMHAQCAEMAHCMFISLIIFMSVHVYR